MFKKARPHVKVLIVFFIIIISTVIYLTVEKGLGNSEAVQVVQENQVIYQVLDTLQYNEAIYDSMRSFFKSDSTPYTSDKNELAKMRELVKTPYTERYRVAQESEIKVLILLFQFIKDAKGEAEPVEDLKTLLGVTDGDTSTINSSND